MFYLFLLLLISSVDIEYPDSSAAWPLGYFAPLRRGYGQYNDSLDFHRGLDFFGRKGREVRAPYPGQGFWVLGVSPDTIRGPCRADCTSVLIAPDSSDQWGWHYAHIFTNLLGYELERDHYYSRDVVTLLRPLSDQQSHIHFAWLDKAAYAPGGPNPQHGWLNPIDYLIRYYGLFNIAAFSPTDGGEWDVFRSITGIVFATEGNNYTCPPQNRVREVIDIIIRPYTYYYQNPTNDSCIVRKVQWRLLWQNPDSCEYQPYNSSFLGTWRTLYDFGGYIHDDDDITTNIPEYSKVFFGGKEHWSNNICLTNTCETPRGDASFPGVETVWIDNYNRQADYDSVEFCRGGWDTRLSTSYGGNPANIDEAADFIDGRYAIEVMAFPQRMDSRTIDTLPVDDITLPDPEVTGIIVDNWAPRIADICLKENEWQIIRDGSYIANIPNNADSGRTLDTNYPPYYFTPYITTGEGNNEYSLEISYSEPVTVIQNIPLTIKMFVGPDSSITWERVINLELDESSLNPEGVCTYARYYNQTGDRPSDYVGNQIVELPINSSWATDLAGNGLDADASTIVTALGIDSISNYESVDTLIVMDEYFYGYYRLYSGSNTIWARYDIIYVPGGGYVYPEHYINLTGELTDAELFNEAPSLSDEELFDGASRSACYIYGGAWMSSDVEDVLHVYIIDYLGNIVMNNTVFDPGSSETSSERCCTAITTPNYWPENRSEDETWDKDRYGWLGWKTISEQGVATCRRDDSVTVYDVELYVTGFDAYNGASVETPVGIGNKWWEDTNLYNTTISYVREYGWEGGVEVEMCIYEYPDTNAVESTIILDAPGTRALSLNSINKDNVSRTGLSSRGIEIEDYFTVFPNPARGSVSIEFMTSETADSTVRIYDISGHLVYTIAEELPGMRDYNLLWNLTDANGHKVPTGIYYVSLDSGSLTETKTVIVIH